MQSPNTPTGFRPQAGTVSKGEREDLQRLIRQREKALKSAAKQRSFEPLADFENQMGQEYRFDQDAVWAKAAECAGREVQKAQKQVDARCRELGSPDRFAPSLHLGWHGRGHDNTIEKRKRKLRTMAETRIAAIERKVITKIEISCPQAQENIALFGFTSGAAWLFIEKLPGIETLMPRLSFAEVAGEAERPIAEQLVSSNALRRRRFPERLRLLRATTISESGCDRCNAICA